MTQDTRTIENRLKWTQDQQSANTVIQSNKAMAGSFDNVADAAAKLGLSADQVKQLNAQLGNVTVNGQQGAAAITQTLQATQTLTAGTQQLAAATNQVAVARKAIHDIDEQASRQRDIASLPDPGIGAFAGDVGGGSTAGTLSKLSQQAINLPGVGFSSPLVIGLRAASVVADKTGASLLELGQAGAVAGIALIAVKLAFDQFNKSIEDSKRALTGAIAAQKNYYDALASSTTKQAQLQVDTLARANELIQAQITETQNAIDQAAHQLSIGSVNGNTSIAGQSLAQVIDLLGGNQLSGNLDKLKTELETNQGTITRLTQGLNAGAFAANDAADAEKRLADARIKDADQEAQTRVQLAALRRSGTVDSVNAELDANHDRETILRTSLIPGVKDLGLTADDAKTRTDALNKELLTLQGVDTLLLQAVLPVVAARENEIAALKADKDYSDALNDSLQEVNKAQVDAAKAADDTATAFRALQQAETDHNTQLQAIQQTYDTATADALRKREDSLAKIQTNADERALVARENLNEQVVSLVSSGHIAEAQAAIRAERLKETQDARKDQTQRDQVAQTYQEQLDSAKVQHEKLLKSETERYQKELTQRRDAYDKAVRDQKSLNDRLESLRQENAFKDIYWVGKVTDAYDKVRLAQGAFTTAMLGYADQINQRNAAGLNWKSVDSSGFTGWGMLNGASGGASKPPSYGAGRIGPKYLGSSPGSYSPLPAVSGTALLLGNPVFNRFDTPSYNTRPGLYESRVPEYHIPAADFNRLGVGSTVNNVNVTLNAQGSNMSLADRQRLKDETKVETVQALTAIHQRRKGGPR